MQPVFRRPVQELVIPIQPTTEPAPPHSQRARAARGRATGSMTRPTVRPGHLLPAPGNKPVHVRQHTPIHHHTAIQIGKPHIGHLRDDVHRRLPASRRRQHHRMLRQPHAIQVRPAHTRGPHVTGHTPHPRQPVILDQQPGRRAPPRIKRPILPLRQSAAHLRPARARHRKPHRHQRRQLVRHTPTSQRTTTKQPTGTSQDQDANQQPCILTIVNPFITKNRQNHSAKYRPRQEDLPHPTPVGVRRHREFPPHRTRQREIKRRTVTQRRIGGRSSDRNGDASDGTIASGNLADNAISDLRLFPISHQHRSFAFPTCIAAQQTRPQKHTPTSHKRLTILVLCH